MSDLASTVLVIAATGAAVIMSFVVVPEILERNGHNPRSPFVRGIVWTTFLAIILIPATASGFLFSIQNVADWLIFAIALTVAVLYDYYRLNPDKAPWVRARR